MKTTWMRNCAIVGLAVAAGVGWAADGDAQLWLKFFADGKLPNGFSVSIEEELRYQDDASEFYDEESLVMLKYDATEWLNIGAGLRVVQERKNKTVYSAKAQDDGSTSYSPVGDGDHYWQSEERPTVEATLKAKLAKWSVDDRNRFEWRMKDDGGDAYLRYRNRLRVKSPWKWTRFKINPYAYVEGFVEDKSSLSGSDLFNRYRCAAGISGSITKNIKSGLYVLSQSDRSSGGGWDRFSVGGFELGVGF